MVVLVRDVMNPKVVVVKPEATVKESAQIMAKFDIGCLVVMGKEKIVGIMTKTDILIKVVATGNDPEQTTVEQVMSKDVVTVDADKTISDASDLLVENHIKRLPVLENGKLVGIITMTDMISYEPKVIESLAELFMLKSGRAVAG